MDNRPIISVVVPIYGIEKYIGLCIESIINQTYKNLEIILVDDGSPDRCSEICDLYAKKDSRIKVLHKKNGGLVSARKAGTQIATGKYIGYVDGDDWIEPTFYEELFLSINDADIAIAGQSRDLFNKTSTIRSVLPAGTYFGTTLKYLLCNMISCGDFFSPGITTYVWNKLFKRELLLKYQMLVDNRISIGEDAAVTYPLLTECKKIVIIDNYDYHYRQREDSMLKKNKLFSEEAKGLKILFDYLLKFAEQQPKEYCLKSQIKDFILSILIMRSGGLAINNYALIPYQQDFKSKDVVIYSAGTFGQQLVNRIKEHSYCNIVGWVDDDYWEYRRCGLDVDSSDNIALLKFDYVVLATVNSRLAETIRENLILKGVDRNKILSILCPDELKADLLKQYLR